MEKKKKTARCTKCDETDTSKFYWLKSVERFHNYCIKCDKENKREYYLKNKAKVDAKNKRWQENNKELHLEHCRKYRKTEKYRKTLKKYREEKVV